MAKYFTTKKIALYLFAILIILRPIVINIFDLDRSLTVQITIDSIFIIIGLIILFLNYYFHKRGNNN
ncbi:hypothetical protein BU596_12380 [Staphylococcus arlettae]|nr:hypothetical protein F9B39_01725 [Staphylococcus sp. CH99b_3]PNZ55086.1 hypothetical protein CD036_04770 [Staphylococcus arlettae]PTH38718.1 hypothetical protein BU596_12380 [Staphylococcus arlettae]